MTFKFNNLQPVQIRMTEKIGWINSRHDYANGGKYYRVAHESATGEYVNRTYAEHELVALAEDDQRKPPGISYIDPPGPPPGGEGPPGGGGEPDPG